MADNLQHNYWVSSPFPHPVEWPKIAFHATKDPVTVKSPDELAALGEEWSVNYADKKRDWPKTKFKLKSEPKEGEVHYETVVVATPEDEGKLGSGWSDTIPPAPGEAPVQAKPANKGGK